MRQRRSFARRSLSLLLCTLLVCALCACGGKAAPPASEQVEWSDISSVSAGSAEPAAEESAPAASSDEVGDGSTKPDEAPEPLSLWTDGSLAKEALLDYVEAVTREDSEDYIPERERVAVFDVDGTLFCETDPIYFDWAMFADRVLDDPDYADEATEEQIDVARRIREAGESGSPSKELGKEQARLNASVYSGMTPEAFNAYTRAWLDRDAPGYTGMKRGEAFYRPMVELVNYLQSEGFTVYLCSGSDRFAVRALVQGTLDLPPSQIIGTDVSLVASGQGDTEGQEYCYTEEDELIRGDRLLVKNGKMNKVSAILREIGTQPVLAFGNSAGDESMGVYVCSHNPHRSMTFLVCCDDVRRERGNQERSEKALELCREHGWTPISMKDDWTTIYGPDVKKR